MKKKLTDNLFLKILSVVFAFILWLVVVNINDPDITRIVTGIPITIINEEKITGQGLGQIYYIESPSSQYGSVMVKGARSIVDDLKPTDIKATVDFGDVSSVGAVTVNYTLPDGVTLVTKRVETMRISIEAMKVDTFGVEIVTKGNTADGYLIGDSKVSPNRVRITAPESILDSIKNVTVEVDIDGMSTDITKQAVLHLYDGNGKEIDYTKNSNITINMTTLNVSIGMLRAQSKPLALEVTGEVKDGYRYLGMSCNVAQVAVKGLPSKVSSFSTITIPASSGILDISELTEKTEITIDLTRYLPEGVSLFNDSDRYVTVTLDVQPLYRKDFYLVMDNIQIENQPEDMDLTFPATTTVATIEGLYEEVDAVTIGGLAPRVDLSGLSDGVHRVKVSLTIPEGIELLNSVDIYVMLTKRVEETSEETSQETSEEISEEETKEVIQENTSNGETEEQLSVLHPSVDEQETSESVESQENTESTENSNPIDHTQTTKSSETSGELENTENSSSNMPAETESSSVAEP